MARKNYHLARRTVDHRKSKSKSKPGWWVWLEWTGNKTQVLPLIEYIVDRNSDGSGVWMAGPEAGLCDASWNFEVFEEITALGLFEDLKDLIKHTTWMYVRLRLLHDFGEDKPLKCERQLRRGKFKPVVVIHRRKRKPRKAAA